MNRILPQLKMEAGWPLKTCITVVFSIILGSNGFASHSVGADLWYECLGGNTYAVNFSFYWDCKGEVDAPGLNGRPLPKIKIKSPSCNQDLELTLKLLPGGGQEVTPICPTEVSTCGDTASPYNGIREWFYSDTLSLPMSCSDWTFSYTLCCRNSNITTLQDPSNEQMHVEATLNNVAVNCNSSPYFTNKPVPFICVSEPYCFNHGAVDKEGDSLYYSLINPLSVDFATSTVQPVNYKSGYSATEPLKSTPPVSFKPNTGDICMVPDQIETTVMAVLVEEFRNGQKIGSVIRDMQLNIIPCNNSNPYTSGIDGTQSCATTSPSTCRFDTTICGDVCFDINSFDENAGQNVSMSWNNGIPDATFTVGSGAKPTGTFCWSPSKEDVGPNPHCFTVEVKDDNCPYFGSNVYSFCVTVASVVEAEINTTDTVYIPCGSDTIVTTTATGGDGNYIYTWGHLEDSVATITLELPGTYIVTATDSKGCSGKDTIVVLFDFPLADFNASASRCKNTPVDFTDNTWIPRGYQIFAWQWDFGDDSTSTLQNPTHTYKDTGTYDVTLIVYAAAGCKDTITQQVTILPLPNPNFSYSNVCQGDTMFLYDSTDISTGSVSSWLWVFGDGQTDTSQNAAHLYNASGEYQLALITESDSGCTNLLTKTVKVLPNPIPDFTPVNGCFPSSINFASTSTIDSGNISVVFWDFDDGTIDSTTAPNYEYNNPGTYDVKLVVTSDQGCVDSITQTLTLFPAAEAGFNFSSTCDGDSTIFTDKSVPSGGSSIIDYDWYFGNGDTSDLQNPKMLYDTAGTYQVTMIVTSTNGCTDTLSKIVNVHHIPVVDLEPEEVCLGTENKFIDKSTAPGAAIASWLWDFNDGTTSQDSSPTYTYGNIGEYLVELTVTTDSGCTDSAIKKIKVHPVPQADFIQTNEGCEPLEATFTDWSIIIGDSLVLWEWDFGDGSGPVEGDTVITHSYLTDLDEPEKFSVKLIVTTSNGCQDSLIRDSLITVYPKPLAAFDPMPDEVTVLSPFVLFNDESVGAISWEYDFGDSSGVSKLQEPVHTYTAPGTYETFQVVTNQYGCKDTVYHTVVVREEYSFYIPRAFTPNQDNINETFSGEGFGVVDQQMFIYDRWGLLIYETNTFNQDNIVPWDGTTPDGHPAQEDVYVYLIKIIDIKGERYEFVGHFNLVR